MIYAILRTEFCHHLFDNFYLTVLILCEFEGCQTEFLGCNCQSRDKNIQIIKRYYDGNVEVAQNSTDSNIPLSMGIPANTIGTVIGGGAHAREEWLDLDSLSVGLKLL